MGIFRLVAMISVATLTLLAIALNALAYDDPCPKQVAVLVPCPDSRPECREENGACPQQGSTAPLANNFEVESSTLDTKCVPESKTAKCYSVYPCRKVGSTCQLDTSSAPIQTIYKTVYETVNCVTPPPGD